MGTQPAGERWLTKQEAAKELKLSTRAVERLSASGQIRRFRETPNKDAGIRYARALYLESDVHKLADNRALGIHAVPATKQEALAVVPIAQAQARVADAQVEAWHGLAAHLSKLSVAFPPPLAKKAWLTFDEAVEHSGLLPVTLSELLRTEQIYAIGRGPKTWRIQRASLDAFGEAPKQ